MRTLLLVFCFLPLLARAQLVQPFNLKLTNGFTMKNCYVVSSTPNSVTLAYIGGVVPVQFSNVDPEHRVGLLRTIQQIRDAQPPASPSYLVTEKPQRPESAQTEEKQSEELQDAIKHGVFYHQLVAGMSQPQVIECMGATPSDRLNGGATWIYRRRGKGFKDPTYPDLGPKDRWLRFRDGILVSWQDI